MPTPTNSTTQEWFVTEKMGYLDVFDERCPVDPAEELEILKKRMLKHRSPGASMLLREMEALDNSLASLFDNLEKFNPQKHHAWYSADRLSRRYVYIKSCIAISFLDHVQKIIEEKIDKFNIDMENTRLYPESKGIAEARAWRADYYRERAKEAREEGAAPKKAASRNTAKKLTRPNCSEARFKLKPDNRS